MTHRVRLVVTGDLTRSRVTVLLRLPLAAPHVVWATFWTSSLALVLPILWLSAAVNGRLKDGPHAFLLRFVRYRVHVIAYVCLLADPWPSFGARESYPLDVEVDGSLTQPRVTLLLRPVLALPAATFASVLLATLAATSILAWFVTLVRGRIPAGMHELGSYCLSYETQTWAYLLMLTPRFPALGWRASPTAAG